MATKIEWTDETWNPITGCRLVSEGCRNCYAARLAATRMKSFPSRAWIVFGNESIGPRNGRFCDLAWARSALAQCREAARGEERDSATGKPRSVSIFCKQIPGEGGRVIKDINHFPPDLRVRDWPRGVMPAATGMPPAAPDGHQEARTAQGRAGKHQEARTARRAGPGSSQEARSGEAATGKQTRGEEGPKALTGT